MDKKKLKRFIDNSFPSPSSYKIETETEDSAVVILDYGRFEPKMKITVEQNYDAYSLLKLVSTEFIGR